MQISLTHPGLVFPGITDADAIEGNTVAASDEDWFDPSIYLGRRGWKYLSHTTRLLIAAVRLSLADSQREPESGGVMIGTNFAAAEVVRSMDDIVRATGSDDLSPALAPAFSVNLPASQVSIAHGMTRFNLTLTNPLVAGVESIIYGASAVRSGRSSWCVAGAVEARCTDRGVLDGAGTVLLEPAGPTTPESALLLRGGFSRFGGDLRATTDLLLATVPELLGAVSEPLRVVVVGPDHVRQQVLDAVTSVCPPGSTPWRGVGDGGEFASASPLLQVAGLMTQTQAALVVAASRNGHVAALHVAPSLAAPALRE